MTSVRALFQLALIAVMGFAGLMATTTAQAATHHHITLGLGYTKLLSDDLKDETLDADLTNAGSGVLAYRYSLNPMVDLAIDSRATVSMEEINGVDFTVTGSYFGPGIRWYPSTASPHPYIQANIFFVTETVEADQGDISIESDESGAGFGITGGVDIPLSTLLSLPLEMHYLYAKPADDMSGLGFTIGLAFNFGLMP